MKRLIILSILLITSILSWGSQPRNSYLSVGYIKSELSKKGENNSLPSRYGMSISAGYTHFFNKKPILGSLYLGLDWTFLYGSFRQYRIHLEDYIPPSELSKYKYPKELQQNIELDQTTIGMQFGPSVTYLPLKDLQISAYYRYAPGLGFIETAVDPFNPPSDVRMESYIESVDYSYVGYNFLGLSVSYKIFMVGIEHKWASMSHRVNTSVGKQNISFKTTGTWFNIGVRLGKSGVKKGKKKNYTYDDNITQVY